LIEKVEKAVEDDEETGVEYESKIPKGDTSLLFEHHQVLL